MGEGGGLSSAAAGEATGQRKAKGAVALRRGKEQEPAGSGGSGGIAEEKDACCSSAAGCEAGTVEEHCNRSI